MTPRTPAAEEARARLLADARALVEERRVALREAAGEYERAYCNRVDRWHLSETPDGAIHRRYAQEREAIAAGKLDRAALAYAAAVLVLEARERES